MEQSRMEQRTMSRKGEEHAIDAAIPRVVIIGEGEVQPKLDGINFVRIKPSINDRLTLNKEFSTVLDESLCSGCRLCDGVCPSLTYDSEKNTMVLNEISCKGCGLCVSICPSGALQQKQFSNGQIIALMDDILLGTVRERKVRSYHCNYCHLSMADIANVKKLKYPSNSTVIRLMCSGMMEASHVLNAFNYGIDGVLVFGCYFGDGSKPSWNEHVEEKIATAKDLMSLLGLDSERLLLDWTSISDEKNFAKVVRRFANGIMEANP
jgi:coenzyme F420-reducing hydrogenase delta subunit/Pyruvate/2-oxoacid:ferredoxin oxidoreductase delta subunit